MLFHICHFHFVCLICHSSTPRALSICQNWPAGPLSDQSVWKWNRLFPRVFAEKLSPSCILFKIWLIWLDSFWLKVKFSLRRERSGRSVETNGKRPKVSQQSHNSKMNKHFFPTVLLALHNLVESFSFARQMWSSVHNQDMIYYKAQCSSIRLKLTLFGQF